MIIGAAVLWAISPFIIIAIVIAIIVIVITYVAVKANEKASYNQGGNKTGSSAFDRIEKQRKKEEEEARKLRKKWKEKKRKEKEKKLEEELKEKEREQRFINKMKDKGFVEYLGNWGSPEQVENWKRIEKETVNNYSSYNPDDFKKLIAKLFDKMNYKVKISPKDKNYGIDILAEKDEEKTAVFVYKNDKGKLVNHKQVQSFLDALARLKVDKGIFVCNTGFSKDAKEMITDSSVELWNKKTLDGMIRGYFIEFEAQRYI